MTELGRQYRRANDGLMPWGDAAQASRVLRELRFCLETSALEERIEKLEAAIDERDAAHRRAHGHNRHHAPPA